MLPCSIPATSDRINSRRHFVPTLLAAAVASTISLQGNAQESPPALENAQESPPLLEEVTSNGNSGPEVALIRIEEMVLSSKTVGGRI